MDKLTSYFIHIIIFVTGIRAKRARHSQVCSIEIGDIIGRAKGAPHWSVQLRYHVIGRVKGAPHWGVQSRFCVVYLKATIISGYKF